LSFFGYDLFTGKQLYRYNADPSEKFTAVGEQAMRTWGPALLNPWGRSADKVYRAFTNKVGDQDTPSKAAAVASEFFGLKARPHDPRLGGQIQSSQLRREINDLTRLIKDSREGDVESEKLNALKKDRQMKKRELDAAVRKLPKDSPKLKAAKLAQKRRRSTKQ